MIKSEKKVCQIIILEKDNLEISSLTKYKYTAISISIFGVPPFTESGAQ